ncbi:MAG: AMP-binding protein, partial [Clostridia bacterium]
MSELIYKKYLKETLNSQNMLVGAEFDIPKNFNFGYDVVDELGKKIPNKTAMIWVSKDFKERYFTFKDIADYSNKTANYFASLGIKRGDKVMLVLKRHYQFWFAIIALHKLGATAVPATNLLLKKDFDYRFNLANIDAIVCTADGDVANEVDLASVTSPSLKTKIIVNGEREGWHNFNEGIEPMSTLFSRVETNANDPMLMYFSSGTTGYPKAAIHSFSYAIGHIITARWWHNVQEDGVHFTVADTGWGKAVWGKLYGQWFCEACIFVFDFDRFHPNEMLPMFAKYNITTFCAPPTIYRFLIKEDLTNYNLSSLKYCTIAGEALNPEVFKQWYQATGIKPMEGFGQTETTLTVGNLVGMQPKPGSMGKPSPQYKVVLLNTESQQIKDGEVGEICIDTTKVPVGLFSGYNNAEVTAEAWHDNYYHTGDMAWRDEDGYFWYVGRTDDLIKSSGYRIGPFEIESVLMELPCVLECAVTGAP